ncbi:MAG TPA: DUF6159 family protein [Thermoplasmata archaeon]|nr:DUF6159 family protein [Thermoplasmata archaeon]
MPGTFSDSWKLTKTSFRLISEDRALLVFPLVAALSILAILVLFLFGAVWVVPLTSLAGNTGTTYQVALVLMFLAMYFAVSWVSVVATAGLIGAATLKLNGKQPTAADGWRVARSRLGALTAWALIAATVGLLIQALARRVGGIAGTVIGVAGGATWGVMTYFMVPVILYERGGAWRSLSRSGHLFISTFGRSLVSNLVLGLIIGAGVVAAVVIGFLGLFVLLGGTWVVGLVLIVAAVAIALVVLLIGSAAEGVLRAALYRYATTGRVDPDLLPIPYQYAGAGPSPPPLAPPLP